jgi:peptidoglycan/LPS O-acetylase OafA/YrhL
VQYPLYQGMKSVLPSRFALHGDQLLLRAETASWQRDLGPAFSVLQSTTAACAKGGRFAFAPDHYLSPRTFRFTLVSLGFALLLPWASVWKLKKENFASLAVRKIGLWSYALYLVHIPILQLLMKYGYQDWHASLSHALILFVFEIGGAILLSALLFQFYERPCTGLRERVAPVVARVFEPRKG